MTQPAPAAPATPANAAPAPANGAPAPVKGPETPPEGQQAPQGAEGGEGGAQAVKKPANQVETELAAAYGEDWDKMPPKAKERVIAAEMKAREADKRMQLAAKLKKDMDMTTGQVNQLIEALKKDPWRVLANPALGHDVKKLAEEYVWNMIQEQKMTPEQREAARLKLENEELRGADERRRKEQEEREFETLKQQRREHWEREIPKAIEQFKLPKTSYTIARFAHYIKSLAKAKIPADMEKIANVVREEISGMQPQFLLPEKFANEKPEDYEDRILASVPPDFLKMLRRADLRKLRQKGLAPKPGPKPGGTAITPAPKKMLMSEWQAQKEARMNQHPN